MFQEPRKWPITLGALASFAVYRFWGNLNVFFTDILGEINIKKFMISNWRETRNNWRMKRCYWQRMPRHKLCVNICQMNLVLIRTISSVSLKDHLLDDLSKWRSKVNQSMSGRIALQIDTSRAQIGYCARFTVTTCLCT